MKSCSKCNVSLPKGVKRWKFQSAEVGGVPGKTGFLCSRCFHDVESVNNRAKANSEHGESQTCSNCKAAFGKSTRSNPNINNTGRLCSNCIHDVELGINSVESESESINSNIAKGKANDESMTCLNCKAVFVKNVKCKGYDRKSLHACRIPLEAFDGKEGFLCYKCIPVVQKELQIKVRKSTRGMTRTPHSMKTRKRVVSVPLYYRETTSKYCSNFNSKKRVLGGFKKAAIDDINNSQYKKAFLTLIGKSKKARQAFYKLVSEYITKDIKAYPKQGMMLTKPPMFDYLKFIPWADIIEEASSPMPFLVHVLKAALPDPRKWERSKKRTLLGQKCLSRKQAKVILDRRLGFMLSVILFSHKSKVFSFIQGCISLQLRKNNCGVNIMKYLNGMGVAKGLHGTVLMMKALKKRQQSAESPSNKTAHDDQGGSVGASCSRAVDLQSLISDVDDDIDMVEQLLQVTSMDF